MEITSQGIFNFCNIGIIIWCIIYIVSLFMFDNKTLAKMAMVICVLHIIEIATWNDEVASGKWFYLDCFWAIMWAFLAYMRWMMPGETDDT